MMDIKEIARIAHEVNRSYCEAIGDTSQASWNNAADWQQKSAVDSVEFLLKNPDVTAKQTHDQWLKFKLDNGWTLGPVKDEAKKEHPCLVSYEELPQDEKVKDYLFRGVVTALLES